MKQLKEETKIKYRVICLGNVLLDNVTMRVAENFISTLTESTQEQAKIVPITEDGLQVLLG